MSLLKTISLRIKGLKPWLVYINFIQSLPWQFTKISGEKPRQQILGFEAGRIENSLLHNFGISFNKNIIKQRRGCCGNSNLN